MTITKKLAYSKADRQTDRQSLSVSLSLPAYSDSFNKPPTCTYYKSFFGYSGSHLKSVLHRQTDRQTDRQAGRQAGRQTDRRNSQCIFID
jgi:hypothetical protein